MPADDEPSPRKSARSDGGGGLAIVAVVVLGIASAGVAGYFIARPDARPTAKNEPGVKGSPEPPQQVSSQSIPMPQARLPDDTVAKIKRATAYIRVTTDSGKVFFGSGFFVPGPGYVVTNSHVIADAKSIEVVLDSGTPRSRALLAPVKGEDLIRDLALLQVAGKNRSPSATPAP
jgi:S1-C subfamily serine protease